MKIAQDVVDFRGSRTIFYFHNEVHIVLFLQTAIVMNIENTINPDSLWDKYSACAALETIL